MDGSACAIVFLQLYPGAEVRYVDPHAPSDFSGRGDGTDTLYADVCPDDFSDGEWVIDHHIGNLERMRGYLPLLGRDADGYRRESVIDTSVCACRLMLARMFAGFELWAGADPKRLRTIRNLNRLVEVVDDYDRWVLARPVSRHLADLHQMMGQTEFVEDFSRRVRSPLWQDDEDMLDQHDHRLIRSLRTQSDAYVRRALQSCWVGDMVDGRRFVAAFSDCLFKNDICHALLDAHPEAHFGVCLDLLRGSGSIRSHDEAHDCAALARLVGGNGHTMAAGFPIPRGVIDEVRAVFG